MKVQLHRGTGYIGSFTALELQVAGYNVVIIDNLYNSSEETINRIELISGIRPVFYQVDVTDQDGLESVFTRHPEISSVIHFAALKVTSQSNMWVVMYISHVLHLFNGRLTLHTYENSQSASPGKYRLNTTV